MCFEHERGQSLLISRKYPSAQTAHEAQVIGKVVDRQQSGTQGLLLGHEVT